jgi:hypothetical protein
MAASILPRNLGEIALDILWAAIIIRLFFEMRINFDTFLYTFFHHPVNCFLNPLLEVPS